MFAYFFSFFQILPEKFAKFLELMLHFIPFHFISVNVIPITVAVHTTYSILCSKTKATPKILFIFRDSIHFVCKFLFWVFNLIFFFSLHSSFFVVCVFFCWIPVVRFLYASIPTANELKCYSIYMLCAWCLCIERSSASEQYVCDPAKFDWWMSYLLILFSFISLFLCIFVMYAFVWFMHSMRAVVRWS